MACVYPDISESTSVVSVARSEMKSESIEKAVDMKLCCTPMNCEKLSQDVATVFPTVGLTEREENCLHRLGPQNTGDGCRLEPGLLWYLPKDVLFRPYASNIQHEITCEALF